MEIFDLPLSSFTLFSFLFIFFLFLLSKKPFSFSSFSQRPKSHAPSPSTYPIIGNLIAFLQNRHRFHDWATDLLSQTPSNTIEIRSFLFSHRGICTAHPANVAHLLKSNFPNYIKGSRFSSPLSDLLGLGIFNVDGDLWSSQRKIASYEFNTRSLKSFVADVVHSQISDRLIPALSAAADASKTLDLQSILQKFTFDNICNLAFGEDPKCLDLDLDLDPSNSNPPFLVAFDDAVEICSNRVMAPTPWIWKIQRFLNVGSERRLKQRIKTIDDYAMKIIDTKLNHRSDRDDRDLDLLSRFMFSSETQDPNQKRKFLRDIIISFVLAGKDSTSIALTWFFWLLSENRRCERRIYAEISEAVAKSGGNLRFEELKEMNYLQAAISEALRLYPPVAIDSRVAVEEDELPDGTYVGAGWFADYSAYAMGRMEGIWGRDCGEFVPERWLEGGGGVFVGAEQFRFPVFHGGPRVCLGKEMAYLQMKAVAAAVIYEFEIEMVRREKPEYGLSLTLKMKGGLPVRIRRRMKK